MGRNIFMAPDPGAMAGRVARLVRQLAGERPGASGEGG
jgi:hypothetical protein